MTKKRQKNPLIPSYNVRHDGWTHTRTKTFLATLRQTGCVADAARVVGMSTTSGYRLRRRDAVFRGAWDAALADARRGLIAVAHERAVVGRETVIIRNGKEVERRITPSDSVLALLIKRGDMSQYGDGEGAGRGRIGNRTADKVITQEEWDKGVRFDAQGAKYEEVEDYRAKLNDKLNLMRERLEQRRQQRFLEGERTINITTGEGITPEVKDAAGRFGGGGSVL